MMRYSMALSFSGRRRHGVESLVPRLQGVKGSSRRAAAPASRYEQGEGHETEYAVEGERSRDARGLRHRTHEESTDGEDAAREQRVEAHDPAAQRIGRRELQRRVAAGDDDRAREADLPQQEGGRPEGARHREPEQPRA